MSTYEAPRDFPDKLPAVPPTQDEIYQLMEIWTNITAINPLNVGGWKGALKAKYMLWTTDDGRQFRVVWDDIKSIFVVEERTEPL